MVLPKKSNGRPPYENATGSWRFDATAAAARTASRRARAAKRGNPGSRPDEGNWKLHWGVLSAF